MKGEKAPLRDLEGETVVITAGPTQEPLDPVRFISNRSSGKMGYALAEAAAARGAKRRPDFRTRGLARPSEVFRWSTSRPPGDANGRPGPSGEATIIIKAAAVADYHVAQVPDAEDEEDRGPAFAGTGSDTGYPG